MTDRLRVHLFDRPVGELALEGPLRSPENWRFAYAADYLALDRPVPLSVALPLQAEPYAGAAVRNWFCNLLPEGAVRDAIERRLRIAVRDDFALLAAIGGECAGAVSVVGGDSRPQPPIDEETDLETLVYQQGDDAGEGAWAALGTPHRLSLAGAQDKIAVVREDDGRLRLPAWGEMSTHILKPDSRRIRGVRDLEAFGLALAHAVGLDTAQAGLVEIAGSRALLVERYDRARAGQATRLHQEDFCQALGYPGELKYESQGGPTLASCADLIRSRLRLGPVAVQGFLDWVVFCATIGNADAHAKNLALLSGRDGRRRLAPFYDLVPTLAIHESLVDRSPAMRIGDARRIDGVTAEEWRRFAAATGYAPGFVLRRVSRMAAAVLGAMPRVADGLVAQGADATRLRAAVSAIQTNAQRLARETGQGAGLGA